MDATSIEALIKLILTIAAIVLFFRWVRNKRNKKFSKHCPRRGLLCHPHPTNLVIKGTGGYPYFTYKCKSCGTVFFNTDKETELKFHVI